MNLETPPTKPGVLNLIRFQALVLEFESPLSTQHLLGATRGRVARHAFESGKLNLGVDGSVP